MREGGTCYVRKYTIIIIMIRLLATCSPFTAERAHHSIPLYVRGEWEFAWEWGREKIFNETVINQQRRDDRGNTSNT